MEKIQACRIAVPLYVLQEPILSKARALNRGMKAAQGELIMLIDDDCRMHPNHIVDLLRHDSETTSPILRGGRIELGDPSDLPVTINLSNSRDQWSLARNSARHDSISGKINGCNMTARRSVFDLIGQFDERFGPGSQFGSGDDTEYIYRAYMKGVTIEHVPDMTVYHFHGRKTVAQGYAVWKRYSLGNGAIWGKYLFACPSLCRPLLWDCKNTIKELIKRKNLFLPELGFSYRHKLFYSLWGLLRHSLSRIID